MKIIKTEQALLRGSVKTNLTFISNLSCGTELKLSVSKVIETRHSYAVWCLANREMIRSNMIMLENRFYRRSSKPTIALIKLGKKMFHCR